MVSFLELKPEANKFAENYKEALNNNTEYATAAKDWGVEQEGAMVLIFEASGEIEDDIKIYLDLKAGKCLDIKILKIDEEPPKEPILTVRAPMPTWKKIAFQELEVIKGLMQNLLKLEGDMGLAMRYAKAAAELANTLEKTDRTLLTKYKLE
ncbi:MAG: hypothetical protein BAJALOKI1v1_1280002 [Promethearchaeota archaeon]|nr:MAG: hypothetical protein BAJALOKI1v1_1280002 [Candidatus Lokiarchaeota archaeon]